MQATKTRAKEIMRVAATIRTRHLSEAEARGIDHDLTEAEFAAAVALAEVPDPHPRPGEPGAWAWHGQRRSVRPPGRRSRCFAG